ncbi:hypothetical protein FA13DRAFT_1785643 [Coprinellus micaceus]|uniref:Uncharacterized protein n=1 Tax=Coprinellus micaceus TaxID=71717 RepID=A0A4Y7TU91_COPMI|nr:hypothetical protein FA13DRAFT_1785643 [Coprinellus micaceus]
MANTINNADTPYLSLFLLPSPPSPPTAVPWMPAQPAPGNDQQDPPRYPPEALSFEHIHNEEHVAMLVNGLRAVKSTSDVQSVEIVHKYHLKARAIPMRVHPLLPVQRILYAGLSLPLVEGWTGYQDDKRVVFGYLKKLIPNIDHTCRALIQIDPHLFTLLHTRLQIAALRGLEANTRSFNEASVGKRLLLEDPLLDEFEPKLLVTLDKSLRGFNNITCRHLICPMEYSELYQRDRDAFLAAVDSGEIKIKAAKIPTLCYPFGHKYVPGWLDENLFESELAVRGINLLLVGSSTIFGGPPASKNRSTAAKHEVVEVDPPILALIYTLLRHTASSAREFSGNDGVFRNDVFYRNIRQLLPEGSEFTKRVLGKLNKKITNLRSAPKGKNTYVTPEDSDEEDIVEDDFDDIYDLEEEVVITAKGTSLQPFAPEDGKGDEQDDQGRQDGQGEQDDKGRQDGQGEQDDKGGQDDTDNDSPEAREVDEREAHSIAAVGARFARQGKFLQALVCLNEALLFAKPGTAKHKEISTCATLVSDRMAKDAQTRKTVRSPAKSQLSQAPLESPAPSSPPKQKRSRSPSTAPVEEPLVAPLDDDKPASERPPTKKRRQRGPRMQGALVPTRQLPPRAGTGRTTSIASYRA